MELPTNQPPSSTPMEVDTKTPERQGVKHVRSDEPPAEQPSKRRRRISESDDDSDDGEGDDEADGDEDEDDSSSSSSSGSDNDSNSDKDDEKDSDGDEDKDDESPDRLGFGDTDSDSDGERSEKPRLGKVLFNKQPKPKVAEMLRGIAALKSVLKPDHTSFTDRDDAALKRAREVNARARRFQALYGVPTNDASLECAWVEESDAPCFVCGNMDAPTSSVKFLICDVCGLCLHSCCTDSKTVPTDEDMKDPKTVFRCPDCWPSSKLDNLPIAGPQPWVLVPSRALRVNEGKAPAVEDFKSSKLSWCEPVVTLIVVIRARSLSLFDGVKLDTEEDAKAFLLSRIGLTARGGNHKKREHRVRVALHLLKAFVWGKYLFYCPYKYAADIDLFLSGSEMRATKNIEGNKARPLLVSNFDGPLLTDSWHHLNPRVFELAVAFWAQHPAAQTCLFLATSLERFLVLAQRSLKASASDEVEKECTVAKALCIEELHNGRIQELEKSLADMNRHAAAAPDKCLQELKLLETHVSQYWTKTEAVRRRAARLKRVKLPLFDKGARLEKAILGPTMLAKTLVSSALSVINDAFDIRLHIGACKIQHRFTIGANNTVPLEFELYDPTLHGTSRRRLFASLNNWEEKTADAMLSVSAFLGENYIDTIEDADSFEFMPIAHVLCVGKTDLDFAIRRCELPIASFASAQALSQRLLARADQLLEMQEESNAQKLRQVVYSMCRTVQSLNPSASLNPQWFVSDSKSDISVMIDRLNTVETQLEITRDFVRNVFAALQSERVEHFSHFKKIATLLDSVKDLLARPSLAHFEDGKSADAIAARIEGLAGGKYLTAIDRAAEVEDAKHEAAEGKVRATRKDKDPKPRSILAMFPGSFELTGLDQNYLIGVSEEDRELQQAMRRIRGRDRAQRADAAHSEDEEVAVEAAVFPPSDDTETESDSEPAKPKDADGDVVMTG